MFKSIVVSTTLMLASMAVQAEPQRYTLDPEHTTVAFLVAHIGYAKTLGQFTEVTGSFVYDEQTNEVSDVLVTVNTDSVQTAHEARDKHLRSKDFLYTGRYPQMSFTASTAAVEENGSAQIAGQLQLLGQTRPLVLSAALNKSGQYPFGHKLYTLGISARAQLLRSDFGMDYGVANAMVDDRVELIIEIEANQDQ